MGIKVATNRARPQGWAAAKQAYQQALGTPVPSGVPEPLNTGLGAVLAGLGPLTEDQGLSSVASPLISIVPRASAAELAKQLTIQKSKNWMDIPAEGENAIALLQAAVNRFAQKYPRIASHVGGVTLERPVGPNAAGEIAAMSGDQGLERLVRGYGMEKTRGRYVYGGYPYQMTVNPDKLSSIKTMQDAEETVGHEMAHAAHSLMDPSRHSTLYDKASEISGYFLNPMEVLARVAGRSFAGQSKVTDSTVRSLAQKMRSHLQNQIQRQGVQGGLPAPKAR